jgi:hypothetical protein
MRALLLLGALLCAAGCPPAPAPDGGQPTDGPCLDRPGVPTQPGNGLPCELYPPGDRK